MRTLKKLASMVRSVFRRSQNEEELDDEIRFHLEMETRKNIESGMSNTEARRQAKVSFGGTERTKEVCRENFGFKPFLDIVSDTLYAKRYLRKRIGFTCSILLIFGICIGANTTFFAALDTIALKPLELKNPEQLVEIFRSDLTSGGTKLGGNLTLFQEYKDQRDIFDNVAYFSNKWVNLQIDGYSYRTNSINVSDDFFTTLGVSPVRGDLLNETSSDGSAVLSYSLWKQQYPNSSDAIGETILIDGRPLSVVGIAPVEAELVQDWPGVFLKIDQTDQVVDSQNEQTRTESEGFIWARIKHGVTTRQAQSALAALEERFNHSASQWYKDTNNPNLRSLHVSTVHNEKTKWAKARLYLLNGAALLVLAIGFVNVSNLLLAQSNSRNHEYWIRRTIGATTPRLIRQCITEILLLTLSGWIVSLTFSHVCIKILDSYSHELFHVNDKLTIGTGAIIYSLVIAIACAVSLGLIVAWKSVTATKSVRSSRPTMQTTADKSSRLLGSLLSVGQTSLTLALLIGVGLLIKSFYQVTTQDLGFSDENVFTGRIHLPDSTYPESEQREQFKTRLLDRLRVIPGVENASLSSTIPTYGYPDNVVTKYNEVSDQNPQSNRSYFCYISPDYLNTLGLTLIEGRDFESSDEFGWQDPMLVDERFAKIHYPNESPIGKRVKIGPPPKNNNNWPVIVGVVETAKHTTIDENDNLPLVYLPIKNSWVNEFSVFIKSGMDSDEIVATLNHEIELIDPSIPLFRTGQLDSIVAQSLLARKGLLTLSLSLGIVALALATVGVYGSAAFRISQSLREFAIRMAIGASEEHLILSSVKHDLKRSAVGICFGIVVALASSRFIASWLYGVQSIDWQIYFALSAIVLCLCGVSSYLPARNGIQYSKLKL